VPQRIAIETQGEITRGFTINLELFSSVYTKVKGNLVYVAKSVDQDTVKKDILKRLFNIC
jgi:hypothetical protein